MELIDQNKGDALVEYTKSIISGQQADEQKEGKAREAERRQKKRHFSDKAGELEVVGHGKTGMQQPSSLTGFAHGPVASGRIPRIPR